MSPRPVQEAQGSPERAGAAKACLAGPWGRRLQLTHSPTVVGTMASCYGHRVERMASLGSPRGPGSPGVIRSSSWGSSPAPGAQAPPLPQPLGFLAAPVLVVTAMGCVQRQGLFDAGDLRAASGCSAAPSARVSGRGPSKTGAVHRTYSPGPSGTISGCSTASGVSTAGCSLSSTAGGAENASEAPGVYFAAHRSAGCVARRVVSPVRSPGAGGGPTLRGAARQSSRSPTPQRCVRRSATPQRAAHAAELLAAAGIPPIWAFRSAPAAAGLRRRIGPPGGGLPARERSPARAGLSQPPWAPSFAPPAPAPASSLPPSPCLGWRPCRGGVRRDADKENAESLASGCAEPSPRAPEKQPPPARPEMECDDDDEQDVLHEQLLLRHPVDAAFFSRLEAGRYRLGDRAVGLKIVGGQLLVTADGEVAPVKLFLRRHRLGSYAGDARAERPAVEPAPEPSPAGSASVSGVTLSDATPSKSGAVLSDAPSEAGSSIAGCGPCAAAPSGSRTPCSPSRSAPQPRTARGAPRTPCRRRSPLPRDTPGSAAPCHGRTRSESPPPVAPRAQHEEGQSLGRGGRSSPRSPKPSNLSQDRRGPGHAAQAKPSPGPTAGRRAGSVSRTSLRSPPKASLRRQKTSATLSRKSSLQQQSASLGGRPQLLH